MAMAHEEAWEEEDSVSVNGMTPSPTAAAPYILHLLPHLSDIPLASKWKTMLESQMKHIPGTATRPNKELKLFDIDVSSWKTLQAAVSAEDRSEVAAVLATRGLLLPSLGQGEENGWSHFLFCFFMALLPSLPNLRRLHLGSGFHSGSSLQEKEEALELFYAAFLTSTTTSIRQLLLFGNRAYGTGKSCGHLAQLLRSSHGHFHSLRSLDADGARGLSSNITRFTKQPVTADSHMGGDSATMPRTNCPLQELLLHDIDMGEDGLAHLCDGLSQSTASSSNLTTLKISGMDGIGEQGALHLGNMLAHNLPLLRKLVVTICNLQDEEGHLALGLQENTSLEELDISYNNLGTRGLELLFRCLEGSNNKNSLKALSIDCSSGKLPQAQDLAAMIVSNSSLQRLSFCDSRMGYDFYSPQDWATHILPAVARNKVLKSLHIRECRGVDGKVVQTALLELLRVNTSIQELDLTSTPLERSGKAAAVDVMLRRNRDYGQILATMPKSKPRSGRIILCGKEYAGKSTLLNTLRLVYARGQGIHYYYHHIKAWGHRLWRSVFPPSDNDRQLSERTRGIHIHLLTDDDAPNGLRVSAWDFAGQREYHALHHFMFPSGRQGAATIFVYTFNPIQIPGHPKAGQVLGGQDLREDFSYWLKFVASNSRPDAPPPQVVVVITSKDKLARQRLETQTWIAAEYQPVITSLAHQFRDVVSVRSEVAFAVNALDANDPDINVLVEWMEGSFRTTLRDLPEVPSICDKVARASQTAAAPIVTTQEFVFTCKTKAEDRGVQLLLDRGGDQEWKAVAAYLHDAGEVIYHNNLDFPFIVLNPRWFGQGILGYLIDLFPQDSLPQRALLRNIFTCCSRPGGRNNQRSATGQEYFSRKDLGELLKVALKNVPGLNSSRSVKEDDLIQLMLLLNLCYEKPFVDSSGEKTIVYFVPAIFHNPKATQDQRPLKWRQIPDANFLFAGCRLESDDCKRTVLTDGFFPVLQVVLHNNSVREWPGSDICTLDKNLFTIMVNGIEVMVEYSSVRYSVDILVMSSKSHEETMRFVESHFIKVIREVCASQEGCPGVSLREAIIRPACCGAGGKNPVLCAHRKDEQVITVDELKRRICKDSNYHHSWGAVKDERGLVLEAAASDSGSCLLGEASGPSTARGSSVMRSDDPDSHGQHIFVEIKDVPILHKAVAGIQFSKVVPLRLHLQCGCRQGGHKVEQQSGRTFYLVNNATRYALEQNIRQGLVLFVASALKMTPVLRGAGSALGSLDLKDGTPIYRDTIESLSERVRGKVACEVGKEDLRFVVEDDMRKGRSSDWMTDFLYGDSSKGARDAFRRDFKLTKVEYNVSSSAHASAWICDEHYKEDSDMCTRS